MKGFEHQHVDGLFTFYRQQAEYQEQKQQQKRQKALKKKQKQQQAEKLRKQQEDCNQKHKEKENENELIEQKQKCLSSSPILEPHRQDYILKAKQYIKELQQNRHNKLMFDHRKRMRRYHYSNYRPSEQPKYKNKQEKDCKQSEKIGNDNLNGLFSLQQSEIFANKKDFAKFNYLMLFDKQVVIPKQFNSIQIFDANKPVQLTSRHYSLQLLNNKKAKDFTERLPRIKKDQYINVHPSLSLLKKDPRKSLNAHYNPMEIIMNNEKFKLSDKIVKNEGKAHKRYESNSIRNQPVQFADTKFLAKKVKGI